MTDRSRTRVEVAAIALLFGAGTAWGTVKAEQGADHARSERFETQLQRIDRRVQALYCAQVAPEIREGCNQ
jgi:hypothetical protein